MKDDVFKRGPHKFNISWKKAVHYNQDQVGKKLNFWPWFSWRENVGLDLVLAIFIGVEIKVIRLI